MAGRVMGRPGAMAPEVRIRVRGTVSDAQRETAMAKLRAACDAAPRPVLAASLELALEQNPSLERPARAKASIDVSGRPVRAHVARPTMDEAIDLLMDRLRRNLLRLAECRQDAVHEPAVPGLGEWRHGGLPASRPHYFPRPEDERQIVRRASPAVPSISPEEAAFEMNMLGHDFHLFTDAGTGADCVLARRADGELELLSPEAGAGRGPAGEPSELEVRPTTTMPLADASRRSTRRTRPSWPSSTPPGDACTSSTAATTATTGSSSRATKTDPAASHAPHPRARPDRGGALGEPAPGRCGFAPRDGGGPRMTGPRRPARLGVRRPEGPGRDPEETMPAPDAIIVHLVQEDSGPDAAPARAPTLRALS